MLAERDIVAEAQAVLTEQFDAELEATLEQEGYDSPTLRERFRITDDGKANWAVREIARKRQAFAAYEAIHKAEMDKIEAAILQPMRDRLEAERKKLEGAESFFTGLLAAYYAPQYDEKHKSFRLPGGTVRLRKNHDEYQRDDARLLKWLKKAKMKKLIRKREEVMWSELKAQGKAVNGRLVLAETGEVVDGVTVVDKGIKLTIETEGV